MAGEENDRLDARDVLSQELLEALGATAKAPHLVMEGRRKRRRGEKREKPAFSEENMPVVRPHKAPESRKKRNRGAAEFLEKDRESRRKRKFLRKLEEEKKKSERRKELLDALAEKQLGVDEAALLKSSGKLNSKETTKERMARDLHLERKGIVSDSGVDEQNESKPKEKKKWQELFNSVKLTVMEKESDESSSSENETAMQMQDGGEEVERSKKVGPIRSENIGEKADDMVDERKEKEGERKKDSVSMQKLRETPKFVVRVRRNTAVEKFRKELPVTMMEQEIMEAIGKHRVIVLCGETGSGKTTQVPQFLFEAGYGCKETPDMDKRGMVAITQPRRVAAVSMARRVRDELGCNDVNKELFGRSVGYQIRHEAFSISKATRLKFMTDGILLQEIREDFLLKKYSVIILDEAHERNLNTDVLLGLLSRIVVLRDRMIEDPVFSDVFPLRIIIMSATLRVSDFVENPRLFQGLERPVLKVEARQYPIVNHFSRRTEMTNYLGAAFKKVCAIHRRLPPGGVLVFLTGQREIEWLVKTLQDKFCKASNKPEVSEKHAEYSDLSSSDEEDEEDRDRDIVKSLARDRIRLARGVIGKKNFEGENPVHVLPLFSRLSTQKQLEVFKDVPKDHRLIVVATNIAETSITIPGIRFVVDSGREKRKVFDQVSGTSRFEIGWISKASADQRKGRAGRTGPGHCYRLYSSAVFNDHFPDFTTPEIMNMPIEDLLLYMKSIGIDHVEAFPFPSMPDLHALSIAESHLIQIGALSHNRVDMKGPSRITNLGRRMIRFPVRARFAKMLSVVACDTNQSIARLGHVVAIVAGLSLNAPFLHHYVLNEGRRGDGDEEKENEEDPVDGSAASAEDERRRALRESADSVSKKWHHEESDVLSLLRASGAYAHVVLFESQGKAQKFCKDYFLHAKTMKEQMQLRRQLSRAVARMRLATVEDEDDSKDDFDIEEESGNQSDDESGDEVTLGLEYQDTIAQEKRKRVKALVRRLDGALRPVSPEDCVFLRQVMASGFLDQIARKMNREEARALAEFRGFRLKKRLWPYISCDVSVTEPLFISPNSNLSKTQSELPEFVAYTHISISTKLKMIEGEEMEESIHYMNQLTSIEPSWLYNLAQGTDQCSCGVVLDQPPPAYESRRDTLMSYVSPTFGPRKWKLPPQWIPFPARTGEEMLDRSSHFARALLEGKVIPAFQQMKEWYAIPPAYMTRKVHDERVRSLQLALRNGPVKKTEKLKQFGPVFSKRMLFQAWEREPTFLLVEVTKLVRKEKRTDVKLLWPKLLIE